LLSLGISYKAQQVGQRDAPPFGGFEIQFFIKVRRLRLAFSSGVPLTVTLDTVIETIKMSLLWNIAKENDLPNWFALAFTVVLWPLALFWWQRRRINNVPNLEVKFSPGGMRIGNEEGPALNITFFNHTG